MSHAKGLARSRFAWAIFAALLVACGGAASESAPKAPSSSPSSVDAPAGEPQTIEEAQAELERARVALSGAASGGAAGMSTTAPTSTPSGGAAQSPTRPAQPQSAAPAPQGAGASAASTCDQVCRAITSMRRAKDAICRLAGPADARCADAQKKVADGETNAISCSCPAK